jgi:hypothetical protein
MFGNLRQSSPFDGVLIDARNERPLTIALATIVAVWSIVFALTFASSQAGAPSLHWAGGAASLISPTAR